MSTCCACWLHAPAKHLCIALCCNNIQEEVAPGSVVTLHMKTCVMWLKTAYILAVRGVHLVLTAIDVVRVLAYQKYARAVFATSVQLWPI